MTFDLASIKEIGGYTTLKIPKLSKMELEAFEEWKDATPERQEEICRKLGEYQAKLILKAIDKEVEKQMKHENIRN